MRSKRNSYNGGRRYSNWYPERYEDRFGSRSYRSSDYYGEGPFGTDYRRGDEFPDEDYYYRRGRHYHADRWYDDGDPYEEDLRDEYDRYGVGLSRGRYYGEPYGSVRGDDRGFFRRAGDRIRDTWQHWTGRDHGDDRYEPARHQGRTGTDRRYGRRPVPGYEQRW